MQRLSCDNPKENPGKKTDMEAQIPPRFYINWTERRVLLSIV
jgi:hypothetical protein